jgi:ketosteroid isomerase-like protein
MNKSQLAKNYLRAFSRRDAVALRSLFSEDITLRDWDQSANGIDAVIAANQGIFDAFSSITVLILHCHESKKTVVVELRIELTNGGESLSLLVTDIIGFDQDGMVNFVRAYKG